jgi:hypothetical protein
VFDYDFELFLFRPPIICPVIKHIIIRREEL